MALFLTCGLLSSVLAASSNRNVDFGKSANLDIAVKEINFFPAQPIAGEEVNFEVTVENLGNIEAEANWHYEVVGAGFGACACCLDINPGESGTFAFDFIPSLSGVYTIQAYSLPVDGEDSNPEDNVQTITITVE